jgi:hypothetical protein
MSSTLNAIDMTPDETPAAEKPTMTAPDPEEAAAKKPTKRSNSFSRRANRGGKKKEEDAMPNAGGVGGVKRGGALGVFAGERGMGKVHGQGADGGANVGVYGRDGGDPVEQGADIEAGSAHEDGQGALFGRL